MKEGVIESMESSKRNVKSSCRRHEATSGPSLASAEAEQAIDSLDPMKSVGRILVMPKVDQQ